MNILLLNVNIGKEWAFGGMEAHAELLASTLIERGHNVILGCWVNGTVKGGATGLLLPARRLRTANSGDIFALLKMVRICLRERIDIIIANHGKDFWPAAIAARLAGIPVLLIRHMENGLKRTTAWLINHHVDKVIAVSEAVRDSLVRCGVDAGKIDVVFNGIPMKRFDPDAFRDATAREELRFGVQDIVIGTSGKLSEEKGVYDLLEACGRIAGVWPDMKLLYVGEGAEKAGISNEARRRAMGNRVVFAGLRRDVAHVYSAIDIFVFPSHSEGMPMALLEAMAMARPVIATRVGGIPEIVHDGVNGILVPPRDPEALARAISRYLEDVPFRTGMARAGRDTVVQRFSETFMGERFETILSGLTRRGSR